MADIIVFPVRDSLRVIASRADHLGNAMVAPQVRRLRREVEVWRTAVDNLDQIVRADPSLASLAAECDRIREMIAAAADKLEPLA
ncbi:hypothetical protein LQG66_13660 [Bradyrhizobium ontarionense]|uniref:Uncharacterized protein n=1 Tax=Bradyrhizobium ontarionense TaxID=2898149 RepID=A0ABY3RIK1_9BRAD|nr:hypothetical protein [Bradyrhizobium sp. A19]UFZ07284.1 hypothetical protein LQG66_13660 [Bradyrhizobium sp. A19]